MSGSLADAATKRREERKRGLRLLYSLIEKYPGESKSKILGLFMFNEGLKKSTAYEYLGVLLDAGMVVERDGMLWTAEAWRAEWERERARELKEEERRARVLSLEAYMTSEG